MGWADPRAHLAGDAVAVAPTLLGAVLTAGDVAIRITEVEAYRGTDDPGSHAFRGRTRRNGVMFGEAGRLYAYFTYGMHVCVNVVTGAVDEPQAVLLRAGEVVAGIETARARRASARRDVDLARGPARLASALGLTLADDGVDLLDGGAVRLVAPAHPEPDTARGPRTGVSGPGGGADYPWRFWLPDDPTVSPYRAHVPRRR
jgi:DNA-3-methyladenine glycosylase